MDYSSNAGALAIRYFDCETGYGFLINQPGLDPLIYLNRTLLGEIPSNPLHQTIYQTLLEYYHSLNIWEFVFPFRRFYEEIASRQAVKADVIILGRFQRSEHYCKTCEAKMLGYRLIG